MQSDSECVGISVVSALTEWTDLSYNLSVADPELSQVLLSLTNDCACDLFHEDPFLSICQRHQNTCIKKI